ncbi:hypothetical protein V6N12_005611 [Hibiscus sabdariffa]|uniref:Uncharacterized protein n=1 Tax=Hibiscus sabdariffa TaxID=183260 RepID=A0ABR2BC83_9ROSI
MNPSNVNLSNAIGDLRSIPRGRPPDVVDLDGLPISTEWPGSPSLQGLQPERKKGWVENIAPTSMDTGNTSDMDDQGDRFVQEQGGSQGGVEVAISFKDKLMGQGGSSITDLDVEDSCFVESGGRN